MTNDKILGCILGAATGDAMGAATETRTMNMIKRDFGGWVKGMTAPPDDCFARGRPAGSVTDDFSLAYVTARLLAGCSGKVDASLARQALLDWADHPEFLAFAGPTTRAAIQRLRGEEIPDPDDYLACNNHRATNGAAMKIFGAGLINPGNLEKTVRDAYTLSLPTHGNNTAISAACAVACAVSKAMEKSASLSDVIDAGLYGAAEGNRQAVEQGLECAMPSVQKRILLAVKIGGQGLPWEEAMRELAEVIGSGLAAADSVPCVFGILAATQGNTMDAITMGVNIGNDTDTIASMAGAIAGALHGTRGIPAEYLQRIDRVNGFDLRALAGSIEEAYYQ